MLVAALAGCGDEASRVPGGRDWPTGEPLAAEGLVWATGHTVHLADGTSVDTQHAFSEYAVAGNAVWFTRADPADPDRSLDRGRLWRASRDGVERTDAHATELAATADGRYLVFLDPVNGPGSEDGTKAYVLVAVDTRTGEETLRTTEGMDDAGGVSLEDAYGEGEPYLAAVSGTTAYVTALGSSHAFDLVTGEVEEVDSDEVPSPGSVPELWNRPHTWAIADSGSLYRDVLRADDGTSVTPRTRRTTWDLLRWLDDDTVLGREVWVAGTPSAHLTLPVDGSILITCEVPSGRCTRVAGSLTTGDEPSPLPQVAEPAQ